MNHVIANQQQQDERLDRMEKLLAQALTHITNEAGDTLLSASGQKLVKGAASLATSD